jgi:hypothetical protein
MNIFKGGENHPFIFSLKEIYNIFTLFNYYNISVALVTPETTAL